MVDLQGEKNGVGEGPAQSTGSAERLFPELCRCFLMVPGNTSGGWRLSIGMG